MERLHNLMLMAQDFNYQGLDLPRGDVNQGTVQNILRIVFVIIGAVAVMMIVIGGIKYSSSQGDPQATSKAKGTIIYAIVGLVIAIFATAIVDFVFGRTV